MFTDDRQLEGYQNKTDRSCELYMRGLGSAPHTYLTSIQYINDSLKIVIYALNVKALILSPISFRSGKVFNSISQEREGHIQTVTGQLWS